MNDEELIAEARRVGYLLSRCSGDVDRLAGALLAELAERQRWAPRKKIDEALAGIERALERGETAWALEQVRLTRGRLALAEGVEE